MTPTEPDAAIVRKCLAGDSRAYGVLVDRYQNVLYNVALRMVRDPDDAADLTQTVFVQAYEKLDRYDPSYKFYSWVYRMTVNAALNFIHRRRRQRPLDGHDPAAATTPADRFAEAELTDRVERALMDLGPEDRALVILKHMEDLPYRDLAFIFDIPEKTVKSRLYTARQRLKDILVTHGLVPTSG